MEDRKPEEQAALAAHRDRLYARLEAGYQKIERGLAEGQEVTTWESFWVSLLAEYQRVIEDLQRDLAV